MEELISILVAAASPFQRAALAASTRRPPMKTTRSLK